MNKEDYFKYYIQGSDHYLIPRDIFEELFNEMNNWKNETKELKEEINKISKKELKVRDMLYSIENGTLTRERLNQIEEVLFELGGDVDDE